MAIDDFDESGDAGIPIDPDAPEPWAQTLTRAVINLVPVFGGFVDVLFTRFEDGRRYHARAMVSSVIDKSSVEQLASSLENPEFAATFQRAVMAAVTTGFEAKRRLLANLIGEAVLDDARVDEVELYVAMLDELDAVHFRSLERLRRAVDDLPQNESREELDRLCKQAWQKEPVPIRAALVRTGCSTAPVVLRGAGPFAVQITATDLVTSFGRDVLEWLKRDGGEGNLRTAGT